MNPNAIPPGARDALAMLISEHGLANVLEAAAGLTNARDNLNASRAAGAITRAANAVRDIVAGR